MGHKKGLNKKSTNKGQIDSVKAGGMKCKYASGYHVIHACLWGSCIFIRQKYSIAHCIIQNIGQ